MSDPTGFVGRNERGDTRRDLGEQCPAGSLHQLAFFGHCDHDRTLFETLTPAERARHAHPEILRQVAEGSIARARQLRPGSTDLHREHEFLESVVQLFVWACVSRQAFPRELFRTLLDWSDELLRTSRLSDVQATCTLALRLGAQRFPELWPWVRLRLARTQMLIGDFDAAQTTLLDTYVRLDRIGDRDAVVALLDALCTTSLQTRHAALFKRLMADRLRLFHTDADERRAVADLTRRAHRGTLRTLASSELSSGDKLLWLACWLSGRLPGRSNGGRISRLLDTCAAGTAYSRQYGGRFSGPVRTKAPSAPITATLVTRAMGGIGDLLMMTPGLRALNAIDACRPVVLAVPRRFFPVFDGNDDVSLVDIDGDLDPSAYGIGSTSPTVPLRASSAGPRRLSERTVSSSSRARLASAAHG